MHLSKVSKHNHKTHTKCRTRCNKDQFHHRCGQLQRKMANSDIFRVQINLGYFFSDYKAKAFVSVNQQWKNVRQLHRHIGDIFDVKRFVLLTNDGVYLPGKCSHV